MAKKLMLYEVVLISKTQFSTRIELSGLARNLADAAIKATKQANKQEAADDFRPQQVREIGTLDF